MALRYYVRGVHILVRSTQNSMFSCVNGGGDLSKHNACYGFAFDCILLRATSKNDCSQVCVIRTVWLLHHAVAACFRLEGEDDEEGDWCEKINSVTVCNNLTDTHRLCLPSSWAGLTTDTTIRFIVKRSIKNVPTDFLLHQN